MNRAEFIRELKENLTDRLPAEQVEDILYDYAEHFDAGMRDGKSEDEVSQELGSPAKVARELLSDGGTHAVGNKAAGLPYAPLGARIVAFIVDSVIAGLPMVIVSKSVVLLLFSPLAPLIALSVPVRMGETPAVVPGVLSFVFFVLYQPLVLALWNGQTLGKRLFNLRVVKKDGSPLTPGFALSREVLGRTIINTVSLGLSGLISFIWALFSPERKTVHDEIGGTRVIVERN